ncbi:MAG: hypothetical protein ABMA25_12075 [Ilumatobacteraceae bacterium]
MSRSQAAIVRAYLEELRSARPKRGRQRTQESLQRRLNEIESKGPSGDVIAALRLAQEKLDLVAELAALRTAADISALEGKFIAVAKAYSDRTGVSYTAWRTVGVPAAALRAAGISAGST